MVQIDIMPKEVIVSKNLQEIIKEVSENPTYYLNENMKKIEEKQCSNLEFYLKAMLQRLEA